jgi:primosomal protein N' (replication factor Y)
LPGIVLIQTVNPDHYAVRYAGMQDYQGFYEKEIQFRKLMRYPPFSALANVMVRSQKQEDALAMSGELERFVSPPPEGLKVLGPAEAPVAKLNSEFRYQVLIKAASRKKLNETLQSIRKQGLEKHWSATGLVIDVDPLTLL